MNHRSPERRASHDPISAHAFVNDTLLQRVYDPAQMLTCTQVVGFPQPMRYNRRLVRWKYTDVLAWVKQQGGTS